MILNDDQLFAVQEQLKKLISSDENIKTITELKQDIEQYTRLITRDGCPIVNDFENIGMMLNATRIWKDWSQQDFARKLEIPLSQLQQYENHYWLTSPYGFVVKAAEILDITIEIRASPVLPKIRTQFHEAMNQIFGGTNQ
jgi:hypothetical protein